ncbi:MAG: hypothetical protein P8X82_12250 [Gemmatimonadales bacterium]
MVRRVVTARLWPVTLPVVRVDEGATELSLRPAAATLLVSEVLLRTGVVRTGCCGNDRLVEVPAFLIAVLAVRRVGVSATRTIVPLVRLPAELVPLPLAVPPLAKATRRAGLVVCPAVYTRRVRDVALYGVLGGVYLILPLLYVE